MKEMKDRPAYWFLTAIGFAIGGIAIDSYGFWFSTTFYLIALVLFVIGVYKLLLSAIEKSWSRTQAENAHEAAFKPGFTILTRVEDLNDNAGVKDWNSSEKAALLAYIAGNLGGEIRFASDAGAFVVLLGIHDQKELYPVIGHAEFLTSYTLNPAELPFQPDPPFDMDPTRELFPGQLNITLTPDGCPESI